MQTQTTTTPTTTAPNLAGLRTAQRKGPHKVTKPAAEPKKTSERTPLKKICAGLKLDPKTARRVLRSRKLGFHDLGNRWELTDSQAKRVKEVLREYLAS